MKQKLLKTMLLLCALVVGSGSAWADSGTLVSALSGIESGETYYIAALNSSKYYTVPNTTISTQTFTCSEGSLSGTTLTVATGAGEFVFTAVSGVSNAYYIYNTNLKQYLVATGSKTFGYVDNTSNDYGYWTFSTVSTGGFSGVFSVQHSSKTHYMRAYNNSVRCYDGANNNGIYLFKKQIPTHTLTYSATNGSISGVNAKSVSVADGASVAEGATVTLTATPTDGYSFTGWSVTGSGSTLSSTSTNPTTFTMGSANSTVTATFVSASICATPTFSVAAGTYNAAQSIELSCVTDGATIYYTTDGTDPTISSSVYSSAIAVNATTTIKAYAVKDGLTNSDIASATYTLKCATPTITIPGTFIETKTVTMTSSDGASIYYTTDGSTTPTSSSTAYDPSNKPSISATTTIKAIATKSGWSDSDVATETFTKITPLTVAEALTAIAALADNGTIDGQYVSGIVSTAGSLSSGAITYYISADGTTTDQLQVYKGKNLNNISFEDATDIQVGDEVVVLGQLKKYKSGSTITPEFNSGNYLISKARKPAPSFSLDPTSKTLDAYTHETVDVTLTTNTDGAITCVSSNTDVATVALKSAGVYTITAQSEGSATITISSAASANYKAASATVDITVEDARVDAGISFAEDEEETTWGESYSTQALTNANSVAVTWSSKDETVATVNGSTGAITILKAGSTTIKATFAGDATYKAAVASYTLTVNKAEAGISYSKTSFDVELNDDSFVAPTLNNPNALEGITYASNNLAIATVNETTGALSLVTTAEGTVKITATFAGNDNYKSGSANYTITVIDPTRKGTKLNPYTVAEVINGTATGSGIYVRGFIVGEYVGKTTDPRTSGFTTDANIAIADEFTTSPTASGSIPVALPTDALKSAWGNKANSGATMRYEVLIKGNQDTYFSVNGIKSTSEVTAISEPVTVTAVGYATYASNYNLDFTGKSIKAYIATTKGDGSGVNFAQINKVPAGTGVLLYKDGGTTESIPVFDGTGADATTGNVFVRGEGETVATDGGTTYNYILNKPADKPLGFYRAAGQTVATNRAYISILKSESAEVKGFIALPGFEETAVKTVKAEAENGVIFNLAGQRVSKLQRGINIINGKKVVVK